MAAKTKEEANHKEELISISSMADPQHPKQVEKVKPAPNYLKPTISSSHSLICRYPKNHHSKTSLLAAANSLSPKQRAGKAPSCPKDNKELNSPKPAAPPRKREVNARDLAKVAEADGEKPRRRNKSTSMGAVEMAAGSKKVKLLPGKKAAGIERKEVVVEEESVALNKQEAQGTNSPRNGVAEGTASQLAERRSRVKALVGAFESGISAQPSQQLESTRKGDESSFDDRIGQRLAEKITHEEKGYSQRQEKTNELTESIEVAVAVDQKFVALI